MPKIEIFLQDGTKLTHDLIDEKITIGRLPDNSVQIDEASVSSHHAEITLERGEYHLHDLGSTNGTFVNDEQITDALLTQGDMVRFGKVDAAYTKEEEGGVSQPLPETEDVGVVPGESSKRPEDFKNSSPFARSLKKFNPVTLGVAALALISLLALAYAVFNVTTMQLQ